MDEEYKNIKILFPLGTLYPSQQGGPSNTVYWMAKALHKCKINVTCIATDLGNPKKSVLSDTWLDTDYGNVMYTNDRHHLFPYKLIKQAILQLKHHNVIHLTSLFYPPSIIIGFISFFLKKKVVWSVRGNLENAAMSISAKRKKLVINLIKVFRKKITFHSTSESETKNIKQYFGLNSKIIEIPNYMELPKVITRHEDINYFLYLGRLHPIKALDNLLIALGRSTFTNSNFKLYLAGNGDDLYRMELEKISQDYGISEKVYFLGQIEGLEKQKLLANAKYTFLVSHTENFGNTVVESLAQGTPVVTSRGTPWSMLKSENAGFWVGNNVENLQEVINSILEMNEKKYKKIRQNCLHLVKNKFDIDQNVKTWIFNYESIVREKA
jgi:glycosyltransferase involved in cell wall biosynthesis